MKKILIIVVLMLVCITVISGCTEKTASISTFDRVETDDFILVYITNYTENMVVDLIQDEYEKGNTYIDCISLDVALIGRSDSMLLFEKGGYSEKLDTPKWLTNRLVTWRGNPDSVKYHIQVSNDTGFNNILLNISDINKYEYPEFYSEKNDRIFFLIPLSFDFRLNDVTGYAYTRIRGLYNDN